MAWTESKIEGSYDKERRYSFHEGFLKVNPASDTYLLIGELASPTTVTIEELTHGAPELTQHQFGNSAVILETGNDTDPTLYRIDTNGRVSRCYQERGEWKAELGFATYYPPLNTQTEVSVAGDPVSLPVTPRYSVLDGLISLVNIGAQRKERKLPLGPIKSITIVSESVSADTTSDASHAFKPPHDAPSWFYTPNFMRAPQQPKPIEKLSSAA